MKSITTKLLSFMLITAMMISSSVPAFASEQNYSSSNTESMNLLNSEVTDENDESDLENSEDVESSDDTYTVINTEETEYGTVYYVIKNKQTNASTGNVGGPRKVSVWDVVDVVMAGASWAELFANPSWGNFGWAVLDTAALLPVLPSTAYFRQGKKTILKIDEVAKFAKTAKGKKAISAAMKAYKYSDGISSKAISAINKEFKKSPKVAKQLISSFKKAADKGLVGATGQTGIKKLKGTVNKIYTHEIKILGEYGAYRIYGYQTKSGSWVFDYFVKSHK